MSNGVKSPLGQVFEEQFHHSDAADPATVLARLSATDIARIISGDKREELFRELAKQFSGEQIEKAKPRMPSVKVVARVHEDRISRFAIDRYEQPLEKPKRISLARIAFIAHYLERDDKDHSTIVVTKGQRSEAYIASKRLHEIKQRILYRSDCKIRLTDNFVGLNNGKISYIDDRRVRILVPHL